MKPFREQTVGPASRAPEGFICLRTRAVACWRERFGANPAAARPLGCGRCTSRPGRAASGWELAGRRCRKVAGRFGARCYSRLGADGLASVRGTTRGPAAGPAPLVPSWGAPCARFGGRWLGCGGAGAVRRAFCGLAVRSPDRPVLKHGPRSPPGAQVVGLVKPEGAAKA